MNGGHGWGKLSVVDDRSFEVLAAVLSGSHLITEDDVAVLLAEQGKDLGARDVALYLADYDQQAVVPVPTADGPERDEVVIDGTVAGRCFRTMRVQKVDVE